MQFTCSQQDAFPLGTQTMSSVIHDFQSLAAPAETN